MQDKYVGDIGDFGKLLIIRELFQISQLKLGVVWCVTNSPETNGDGSHRSFLSYPTKHSISSCDQDLFERFLHLQPDAQRKIKNLHPLIPSLAFCEGRTDTGNREKFIAEALQQTSACELVFFDPDNGIAADRPSPKHIGLAELHLFWKRGQSLIVYHHLSREKGGHQLTLNSLKRELINRFGNCVVDAIRLRRGTSRVYFVISQPEHAQRLRLAHEREQKWYPLTMPKNEWQKSRDTTA